MHMAKKILSVLSIVGISALALFFLSDSMSNKDILKSNMVGKFTLLLF